jgi:hypothetical protein
MSSLCGFQATLVSLVSGSAMHLTLAGGQTNVTCPLLAARILGAGLGQKRGQSGNAPAAGGDVVIDRAFRQGLSQELLLSVRTDVGADDPAPCTHHRGPNAGAGTSSVHGSARKIGYEPNRNSTAVHALYFAAVT